MIDPYEEFHTFADYLRSTGRIGDVRRYKRNMAAFLEHMRHFKAYELAAPFCKDKGVIELGCGSGYGSQYIAQRSAEVVAIDIDRAALRFAAKKHSEPNLDFMAADINLLPFQKGCFDVVISFQVIEHIKPKQVPAFLSGIRRILKGNGVALISTPNRRFSLQPFQRPINREHYTEYTVNRLYKLLQHDFEEVELLGLRAASWIEELCNKKPSIAEAYVLHPAARATKSILPSQMAQSFIKRVKTTAIKFHVARTVSEDNNSDDEFLRRVKSFSMENFWWEKASLDSSMCLLGVCRNLSKR